MAKDSYAGRTALFPICCAFPSPRCRAGRGSSCSRQAGRERLRALGIKSLLPPDLQSNTITCFHMPAGLSYQTLHDRLKEQGYVIYAGQGPLEGKTFRIANMGVLTVDNVQGFLRAFEQTLESAAVPS